MEEDKPQKWRLLTTGFLNAFENMAIDEAILKACSEGKSSPTIRFYGWKPHAVSLGYTQQVEGTINLQACERLGTDIVRRLTGGKAVLHDEELTYSFVCSSGNPLFPKNIMGTYKKISSCLIEGFKRLDIDAQLITPKAGKVGLPEKKSNPSCFSSPSRYEISVCGRKICGSSQRRVNGAFLQHGSILIGFDAQKLSRIMVFKGLKREVAVDYLDRNITSVNDHAGKDIDFFKLQGIFAEGFQKGLEIELRKGELSPQEHQLKEQYLKERYLNPEWNFGMPGGHRDWLQKGSAENWLLWLEIRFLINEEIIMVEINRFFLCHINGGEVLSLVVHHSCDRGDFLSCTIFRGIFRCGDCKKNF
jgi:lipoate-protein ligase A